MPTLIPALLAALTLTADPQEHPIAAAVRPALKDPAKPFVMVVRIKVKDGAGPKFEAAFVKAAAASRKEPGNKAYDLSRSAKGANEYLVYERWANLAALEAHLKSPHFREVSAATQDLWSGPPDLQ